MDGNCIFHDGKPEAGPAEFARAAFVNTIETFEDVFQMLWLYSRPVVAHRELVEMSAF